MYYHKINSLYKRDMKIKGHPIIQGEFVNETYRMLKDIEWVGYEKIDGTNIVVEYDPILTVIKVYGRTAKAQVPSELINKINILFDLKKLHQIFKDNPPSSIYFYGEGISHKIQGGGKYFKEGKGWNFILFDVRIGKWWLKDEDVTSMANSLNIDRAPLVIKGTLATIEQLVRSGLKSRFGNFWAEGVVAKPKYQLFTRSGERIITKIKHKDFFNGQNKNSVIRKRK